MRFDLTADEQWLIVNALACYRDEVRKLAAAERTEAESGDFRQEHLKLATTWDATAVRADDLMFKIQEAPDAL